MAVISRVPAPRGAPLDDPGRVFVSKLELSAPPPAGQLPVPEGYHRVRILVRCHGEVLGYLDERLPAEGLPTAELVARSVVRFRDRIEAHLGAECLDWPRGPQESIPPAGPSCPSQPSTSPLVSLVVCTRERPKILAGCLTHLRTLTHPLLDVVVVDNAPRSDSTRDVFEREVGGDARFRYVREPVAGLSRARNRGIFEARGEIVAYTDDDVTVEPEWISALVRGFERDPKVGCVTGLVATAAIDGPAERYFDSRVSWARNCTPRLYDLGGRRGDNALYPYSAGIFGTGANFAFRKTAVEGIGGFDEALGAGTPAKGGEDLDAFVEILRAGWVLAYEPNAVVWHHHRTDLDELRRQMYGYGTGLSAFATKHLLDHGSRPDVLRRVVPGALRLTTALRKASRGGDAKDESDALGSRPKGLVLNELRGLIAGPFLYLRGRRATRRTANRT